MDKKSIIGIVLIFAILVVFSLMNQPSKEEIEAAKQKKDSIALVEAEKAIVQQQQQAVQNKPVITANDSVSVATELQNKRDQLGVFGAAAVGEEKFSTLENNLMKITFSNKGGKIYSVQLKNYQTHDTLPLMLFKGPETQFGLNFFAQNRSIQTSELYFIPSARMKETV